MSDARLGDARLGDASGGDAGRGGLAAFGADTLVLRMELPPLDGVGTRWRPARAGIAWRMRRVTSDQGG